MSVSASCCRFELALAGFSLQPIRLQFYLFYRFYFTSAAKAAKLFHREVWPRAQPHQGPALLCVGGRKVSLLGLLVLKQNGISKTNRMSIQQRVAGAKPLEVQKKYSLCKSLGFAGVQNPWFCWGAIDYLVCVILSSCNT